MTRILLIEDTPILSELYMKALQGDGHDVTLAETGRDAQRHFEEDRPDLVFVDLHLPDMNGVDLLRRMKQIDRAPAIVVITAYSSINVAVEAMREGAQDFLAKPFPLERLLVTARNTLETRRLARELTQLNSEKRRRFHGFTGASPIMQAVYRSIETIAASRAPVFVTGDSGTGKEICAEAIHAASARRDRPFIALNCAAIPRDLVESEIFGHVRGAFSGATSDRQGAACMADGGTLFLDEICEMDLSLQAKLLRFLQNYTVTPVGSNSSRKVDIRIIAATNRDPAREVAAGRFREDLYYRLHVVPIALPRLADRGPDIIEIATGFLKDYAREEKKSFAGFSEEAERALSTYAWPGNVRELQNVVRGLVALHDGTHATLDMLPRDVREGERAPVLVWSNTEPVRPLREIEKDAIEGAVTLCEGNIHRAAALLEVSPSTIYRKRLNWGDDESIAHDASA